MSEFNKAASLNELLDMLNSDSASKLFADGMLEGVLCELPTFGGEQPNDSAITDCFSWDETRYLQANTCTGDDFILVDRY